jgi:hypothetical protein
MTIKIDYEFKFGTFFANTTIDDRFITAASFTGYAEAKEHLIQKIKTTIAAVKATPDSELVTI